MSIFIFVALVLLRSASSSWIFIIKKISFGLFSRVCSWIRDALEHALRLWFEAFHSYIVLRAIYCMYLRYISTNFYVGQEEYFAHCSHKVSDWYPFINLIYVPWQQKQKRSFKEIIYQFLINSKNE